MAFTKKLSKLKIEQGRRITYEFPFSLGGGKDGDGLVRLEVVPAAGYYNPGLAADAAAHAQQPPPDDLPDEAKAQLLGRRHAFLYSRNVVVAWANVIDDDGAEAPCTPENVNEFLIGVNEQAPDLFFTFINFCSDMRNWRLDTEVLAKKS